MSDRPPIDQLFHAMCQLGASDLHLCVGNVPMVRKDGHMQPLNDTTPPLTEEGLQRLLQPIIPEKNKHEFIERNDTDFAYEIPDLARFRSNIFSDRKGPGAVFRVIPSKILTAEALGLSPHILQLCQLNKGLVLVTGPTGSGKSTTLCAMIDYVNRMRPDHIITIEDPIEFVHENKKCLINQREVGTHTNSFKDALRAALREDPDILLVGELRDLETVAIAIETAETGHLVFGTLHTTTAASTVDRVIDQFPADRQAQIRVMLSESLKGVIAQTLCRKIGGGRVAALEVLIATSAVGNLIREGKTFQIPSIMQVNKAAGMVSLNDALIDLVTKKLVAPEEAMAKAVDKAGFDSMLKRAGINLPTQGPSPWPPVRRRPSRSSDPARRSILPVASARVRLSALGSLHSAPVPASGRPLTQLTVESDRRRQERISLNRRASMRARSFAWLLVLSLVSLSGGLVVQGTQTPPAKPYQPASRTGRQRRGLGPDRIRRWSTRCSIWPRSRRRTS